MTEAKFNSRYVMKPSMEQANPSCKFMLENLMEEQRFRLRISVLKKGISTKPAIIIPAAIMM